jgi:acyl-CoA synthetase (NDP forming)
MFKSTACGAAFFAMCVVLLRAANNIDMAYFATETIHKGGNRARLVIETPVSAVVAILLILGIIVFEVLKKRRR